MFVLVGGLHGGVVAYLGLHRVLDVAGIGLNDPISVVCGFVGDADCGSFRETGGALTPGGDGISVMVDCVIYSLQ